MDSKEIGRKPYNSLKKKVHFLGEVYRNREKTRNFTFAYNTIINLIVKGGTFILNFLAVPLLIKLLTKYNFGIWEIAFTFSSYAVILNFGLGNSLRNLVTINLVRKKKSKINHLISVTLMLSIVLCLSFLLIATLLFFIFKHKLLQLPDEVFWFFAITFVSFLINIVLGVYSSIALSFQKSYLVSIYSFFSSLLFLIGLYVINYFDIPNPLVLIAVWFNAFTILCNAILGFHLYRANKWVAFKMPYRNIKAYCLTIISKGKQFTLVQFAILFLFSSDSIIIGALYSVEEVGPYSIVNKLYFYIITIYSILLIQLWNSITQAYAMGDFVWIRTMKKRLEMLIIPVIALIVLVNIFGQQLFGLWVGKDFHVNKNILFILGIYTIFHVWNGIYVNILNGMGVLKQQIVLYVLGNILLLGATLLISNFDLDIEYFALSKTVIIVIISISLFFVYSRKVEKK